MNLLYRIVFTTAALSLAGCATVDVVKVPPGPQGDKVKGFRYYMPRPCVAVRKPFPVVGKDFYVYGTIQDGNLVSIETAQLKCLNPYFAFPVEDGKTKLPLGSLSNPQTQGAKADPAAAPAADAAKTDTGLSESKVTAGDATASPLLKVNDYYDIVEMPDFTQMYAVQTDGGVGAATTSLNLAGGWMLSKADVSLDNKELGKLISDSITKVLDLGLSVAKGAFLPGSSALPTTQGQKVTDSPSVVNLSAGTKVLVRIRYYLEAQVGVYPFLKPEEVSKTRIGGGIDPSDYVYIPYGPYQVAYSVRKTIDLEIVKVTGAPATEVRHEGTGGDLLKGTDFVSEIEGWWGKDKAKAEEILPYSKILHAYWVVNSKELNLVTKDEVPKSSEVGTQLNAKLPLIPLRINKGQDTVSGFTLTTEGISTHP